MLNVQNLRKHFGSIEAVRDVSFSVEKGEVLGFLGPNGAGKSTTMRMITGFIPPTGGTASICGFDIVSQPVEAKAQLGYLPESAPSYPAMTVFEFLEYAAALRGYRGSEKRDRIEQTIIRCHLENVRNQTIETLSKGFRQRTCMAQAILHDPPVLIMDEPTDGLDPNQKHVVRQMIREMAASKAIIVSTHILEEVDTVCSRAIIIARGRIVYDGKAADFKARAKNGRLDEFFRELTMTGEEN